MQLKTSLVVAAVLGFALLGGWELYLRSTKKTITLLDDDSALWAAQRHRVPQLDDDQVVIIGSSRILFDVQLDVWEEKTGIRPVELATVGSSPLPIFHDLVNNTEYTGTIMVGVTPGLFFSTTYPKAQPWSWPQARVDHYHDRTYADRTNHLLSIPLQKSLYFISAEEDETSDNVDLKAILSRIHIGPRGPEPEIPFPQFSEIETDRSLRMTAITAQDTSVANTVQRAWLSILMDPDMPPPDPESTTAFFLKDARKFLGRGGKLIMLRCPSSGPIAEGESKFLNRAGFWDPLIDSLQVPAYNYLDYPQLQGYECPEWSHLKYEDALTFTDDLVEIMLEDKTITNLKTQ